MKFGWTVMKVYESFPLGEKRKAVSICGYNISAIIIILL